MVIKEESETTEKMLDHLRVCSNIFLRYIDIFTLNNHKLNIQFFPFLKNLRYVPASSF